MWSLNWFLASKISLTFDRLLTHFHHFFVYVLLSNEEPFWQQYIKILIFIKDLTPLWSPGRQVTNFSSAMSLDRLKRWHPTGRGFVSHVTPLASGGPPASFAYLHRRGIIKMPNRKYNCAGDLWIVTTRSGELRPPARPSCDSNMLEPFCCKVWRSRDRPEGTVLKLLGASLYCGYNLPTW